MKYTGNEPPYALRDSSMDERRVLFEMQVVKVATFGRRNRGKEPPMSGVPRSSSSAGRSAA